MKEAAAALVAHLQVAQRKAEVKDQNHALIEIEDQDTRAVISEDSLKRYKPMQNFSLPILTQK